MRIQPEHCRAVVGRIAAQPFEDARAVVQSVCEDVHFGVVPGNEPAVEPDVLGRCETHGGQYISGAATLAAVVSDVLYSSGSVEARTPYLASPLRNSVPAFSGTTNPSRIS